MDDLSSRDVPAQAPERSDWTWYRRPQEAPAWRLIDRMADDFVDLALKCGLWASGGGDGDVILDALYRAASRAGRHLGPTYAGMRDLSDPACLLSPDGPEE